MSLITRGYGSQGGILIVPRGLGRKMSEVYRCRLHHTHEQGEKIHSTHW